ncbi:MAG: isovaleryl-CoA dehydrogenase [Verrucomicrobia bacterium]|nr:isovaleryl-CoA dehydrogenase [Verrucomicrobiota bacterium]
MGALYPPDAVFNQPPPLEDYNLFESDSALKEAVQREGAGWINADASRFGAFLGRPETINLGVQANRFAPELRTHDRFGYRIDEVVYHPAYHELMRIGIEARCHSLPWVESRPGAQVARAVLLMLRHQVDEGSSCPLTMTFAAIPSLRLQPELVAEWEPRALSSVYDPRAIPASEKGGVLFGMGMTERQGGSDVRANTTWAESVDGGGPGREYILTGHKWFCSAPMCDAFFILAQTVGGLSCFLMPRWRSDGTRNAFHLLRLKDKLGNRSNASGEVEFRRASARLVGEEGRGVATIMEMVRHTRLDCALGSAAAVRKAVAEATHHAAHRSAFGRRLIDQPLMRNVLADLCLESEAATTLAIRLARAFDRSKEDPREQKFARIATAIAKYWVTKRTPVIVAEALECLGGNGYIEESPLPRLYRDAPLNSLWEGAGNVQCLDVLKAMQKDPETIAALRQELASTTGANSIFDHFIASLLSAKEIAGAEFGARRLVEQLALALEASALIRSGNQPVADLFCAARLTERPGLAFGTLRSEEGVTLLLERAQPRTGHTAGTTEESGHND